MASEGFPGRGNQAVGLIGGSVRPAAWGQPVPEQSSGLGRSFPSAVEVMGTRPSADTEGMIDRGSRPCTRFGAAPSISLALVL